MAKLFVCGDITNPILGSGFVGEDLKEKIRLADYAICNFEGPELMKEQKASCPHQEAGTAAYLKSVGFNLMLLANNHITELGADGVRYSIESIHKAGADCMGAGLSWEEAYRPMICIIDEMCFGFINICEAQVGQYVSHDQPFGYAWMGYDNLIDDIHQLARKTDRVVVFVHAGLEHHLIPLPELRAFYKKICDAGACCVVGSHPHSAQGYEFYGNKPIFYSLGNFYFPRFNGSWPDENTSYSVLLDFKKDGTTIPTLIHHSLIDEKVKLQTDKNKQVDLVSLCNMLADGYDCLANEMCVSVYRNLCSHLLASATCGEYDEMKFMNVLKNAAKNILFRKRIVVSTKAKRNALLLRLFENESYRYTIIRALKHI